MNLKTKFELMDLSSKAAARLTTGVRKNLERCMDFYKRMITTHNRCQTFVAKRIQEFLDREEHLKYLQVRLQEDELGIQQVKGLNEKEVKNLVAQDAVSNYLLEDQLQVNPPKVAEIKSQLATHEVTVILLEPMDFKAIAAEAATWKEFIGGLAKSS